MAVRAYDGVDATGTEMIKTNNGGTAWTGTTASTPRVAVSSGLGVQVLSNTCLLYTSRCV